MATDSEVSDRISSKKQRTLSKINGRGELNCYSTEDDRPAGPSSSLQEDYEEEKRRKLLEWQAWQVRKASEDNSFNEMFIPINPSDYSLYEILTELNMENQAVSMAIQNHGLVCSTNLSQPQTFSNFMFECFSIERRLDLLKNTENVDNTRNFNKLEVSLNEEQISVKDKAYDNDQQQDFLLEQAVAEAIKKKGLSALTVDYG